MNSLLVWMFALRLTHRRGVSFLCAVLFAVHPCHVESVAWVSGRKDLLAFGFGLSSVMAYMRAQNGSGSPRLFWALSFVLFVLAVLSKVAVAVLPLFFLFLDLKATDRPRESLWASALRWLPNKIPYLVIAVIVAIQNARVQVTATDHGESALEFALIKAHALARYFALLCGMERGQPTYDLPSIATGQGLISQRHEATGVLDSAK